MSTMASRITSWAIVYTSVYSGTDQRKPQSSASLAFVRGIHRWPVNFPHKGPVTRKVFPFDDVVMTSSWYSLSVGHNSNHDVQTPRELSLSALLAREIRRVPHSEGFAVMVKQWHAATHTNRSRRNPRSRCAWLTGPDPRSGYARTSFGIDAAAEVTIWFESVIYGNPEHSNWHQSFPTLIWLFLAQCGIPAGFIKTMQVEEMQNYKKYIICCGVKPKSGEKK